MLERLKNHDEFRRLCAESLDAIRVQPKGDEGGGTAVHADLDGFPRPPAVVSKDGVLVVWRLWWAEGR